MSKPWLGIQAQGWGEEKRVYAQFGEGLVVHLAERAAIPSNDAVREAPDGVCLFPGFVDLYTQLTDPGQEYRATLSAIAADAQMGGFSDVLLHGSSSTSLAIASEVQALRARAKPLPVSFHVAGALTEGYGGSEMAELGELARVGVRAFSDGARGVQSPSVLMRCLQFVQSVSAAPVMQVPTDFGIVGEGIANESPAIVRLGLASIPPLAESLHLSKCLQILAYTGGRLHVSPITTAASVALIARAKAEGLHVTAGTSPAHLLLNDTHLSAFESRYKFQPPLRDEADVHALRAAVIDGTIDVIASHHSPVSIDDKMCEFSLASFGAPALRDTFGAVVAALGKGPQGFSEILKLMRYRPMEILWGEQPTERMSVGMRCFVGLPNGDSRLAEPFHPPSDAICNPFFGQALRARICSPEAYLAILGRQL
jgi:dihydroorotase